MSARLEILKKFNYLSKKNTTATEIKKLKKEEHGEVLNNLI
jgi:hypothetical protein